MSKKAPTAEEIAAVFGLDVNEVAEKLPNHGTTAHVKRARELDAARDRIYQPDRWYDIQCKYCGRMFSADYKYVALCSDDCRKKDFESIGLIWDPNKSEDERYIAMRIEPPAIVPPAAFSALLQLANQYSTVSRLNPGVNTQT